MLYTRLALHLTDNVIFYAGMTNFVDNSGLERIAIWPSRTSGFSSGLVTCYSQGSLQVVCHEPCTCNRTNVP